MNLPSLYDALCRVRDKRDDNRTFHIGGMLSIVVMASMSGANSVKAIARFAQRLDMPQRRELCMPHAKSKAGVVANARCSRRICSQIGHSRYGWW